jgi:hypothetical protein
MSNLIINKEGDYKNSNVSSVPLGINNIILDNNDNIFDLKKDNINNIRPMLSEGKKVKIRPMSNKKVPFNTFSSIANNKKNMNGNSSDDNSEESSNASDDSDEILSNNTHSTYNSNRGNDRKDEKRNRQQEEDDESEEEEEYTEDDYSSIQSGKYKDNNSGGESTYESSEGDDESEKEPPKKQKTYEEIQQEKQKILFNLERLQKQGYPPSKKYSMASSYEDMVFEHDRLKKQRDVEKSIKFSRKVLMAFVSGAEFLNGKFDYFDIKLNGWSENVMENVTDYDEVFEELHEKYADSVKMAPEIKLLGLVSSSAFMFHLTNTLFKSSKSDVNDIIKENPDIMRNIQEAAARKMNNTINQEFGEGDVLGNIMKNGINTRMNQQRPEQRPEQRPGPQLGPQAKMTGPIGIDDLLDELNNDSGGRDDVSVSSTGSGTIRSSARRTKTGKRTGIQLDI